jgi:CheY-like chemotaxis protein
LVNQNQKTTNTGGLVDKKVILLVEDDVDAQMFFLDEVGDRARVICAGTEEDAFKIYDAIKNFDLIVLDGELHHTTTLSFGEHVRDSGYTGTMVACSKSPDFRRLQMKHGCDYECGLKPAAGRLALRILGLS